MAAVDAIDRVREASPRGFQYLDDDGKTGAMADSIDRLTKAGVAPQQAITMARTNAAMGDNDRARMDELWKQGRSELFGTGDTGIDKALKKQINDNAQLVPQHWYGNTNVPRPPAMQADFYAATRAYFNYNGGNAQAAAASAARDIGTTWGLTAMNGAPEIVRYPPERMFRAPDGGPGLTAEDIRTDIAQTVANSPDAFTHWDADKRAMVPFQVDPNNVKVLESPRTALTNGRTWGLSYQTPDGVTEALYGKDGKPLEYNLPVTTQDYKAMRDQATKEAIAKAQQRYEAQTAAEKSARALLIMQQNEEDGR
jgi:hypothetical protein